MREKLIELINAVLRCLPWGEISSHTADDVADHLIANGVVISKMETVATDNNVGRKWISVKDRLPDTECLAVSMLTGPAYKEMLVGYVAEASNWDTGYKCESDGEILPNVTHWMPLPEPPKGG